MEEEEGSSVGSRKSKDKVVNVEGKRLCRFVGERGWEILNGNVEGDEEGEWTYTGGRGSSVIDYVLEKEDTRERVKRMEVGERVDSDHHRGVAEGGKEGEEGKGEDWRREGV